YRPLVLGSRFHFPLLPCPRNQINSGATRSAQWQIAAAVLSLPPHSTSTTRTSTLSCVRQSSRSSSHPSGLEAGARTRKKVTPPSRATTRPPQRRGATQIGSKHVSWIKLKNGLPSSSVNRPSPSTLHEHTRIDSTRFSYQMGWALAPCVTQNP